MCIIHDHLTDSETLHIFGVNDRSRIPDYNYGSISDDDDFHSITSQSREKHSDHKHQRRKREMLQTLKLSTDDNEVFEIELTPNKRLISPNVVSFIRDDQDDDNGTSSAFYGRLPIESNCHYKGRVKSHGDASAAVSLCTKHNSVRLI